MHWLAFSGINKKTPAKLNTKNRKSNKQTKKQQQKNYY